MDQYKQVNTLSYITFSLDEYALLGPICFNENVPPLTYISFVLKKCRSEQICDVLYPFKTKEMMIKFNILNDSNVQ